MCTGISDLAAVLSEDDVPFADKRIGDSYLQLIRQMVVAGTRET